MCQLTLFDEPIADYEPEPPPIQPAPRKRPPPYIPKPGEEASRIRKKMARTARALPVHQLYGIIEELIRSPKQFDLMRVEVARAELARRQEK